MSAAGITDGETVRMQSVGLKWEDFTLTDNTCKPHPANKRFSFNIFSGVQQLEATLEDDLKSFSKGFTTLETSACPAAYG